MTTKNDKAEKKIAAAKKRFSSSLPKRAVCPHCKKRLDIDAFGLRLMNGPAVRAGEAEPRFARQSRCGPCRRAVRS